MAVYRGSVVSFDSLNWKADVRLDGSQAQSLAGVKTSRNIAAVEMTAGRKVLVDTGDHGDLADVVVFAVFT
jgi:hypothetical protein